MQTEMQCDMALSYKSASQRARVITELWGQKNLYCANCNSPELIQSRPNTQAVDFTCPSCGSPFQLKSQCAPFSRRIVDAGYEAMCRAINEDRTPNLIATQYDSSEWRIKNAILIPRFAFSLSAIEKRKPLAPSARRAGWVGCNILLCNIPEDVKIHLVKEGVPSNPRLVRRKFTELKPLSQFNVQIRGWALDVLNIASSLKQDKFSLGDIYKYEETFETLHPINQHIRPKIRQQLQKLRDLGIITFLGNGQYQFKTSSHPEC